MSSLRASATSGVAWSALQNWLARASGAAAFVVLGRQLDPTAFGLIALAIAVTAVLAALAESGLSTFVVRTESITPRLLSTAFWTALALSAVFALTLVATAGPIAKAFGEPELTAVLRWLSAGLLLTGLASVPTALMRRELRFKQLALRGTAAALVSSAVAVILALLGAGVWALVAQYLVNGLVSAIVVWLATRWRPSLAWDPVISWKMLKFGSQLLGIDLLDQARSRGQDFMIAGFLGSAALGTWSVSSRLLSIVLDTGTSVINAVATPIFAKMQGTKDRLFRAYSISLATASAVTFPAMLFLAVTSPDVVPAILGEQWSYTASIAQIAAISAAVSSLSYFDRSIFIALDKLKAELLLVTVSVASQLLVVAAMAPYGLMHLAAGFLVRNILIVPFRMFWINRTTGLPYSSIVPALRVFVAAAAMAGTVFFTLHVLSSADRWTTIAVCGLVALVAYPIWLRLIAAPVAKTLASEATSAIRSRRRIKTIEESGSHKAGETRSSLNSAT